VAGGENNVEEVRRHAQEWIEVNRDMVNPWLEATRSAAQRQ
jgi:ABC-type proline/glycine betaine transport system substrate-binding protein